MRGPLLAFGWICARSPQQGYHEQNITARKAHCVLRTVRMPPTGLYTREADFVERGD